MRFSQASTRAFHMQRKIRVFLVFTAKRIDGEVDDDVDGKNNKMNNK